MGLQCHTVYVETSESVKRIITVRYCTVQATPKTTNTLETVGQTFAVED